MWWLLGGWALVVIVAHAGWLAWDCHVRYGPLTPGNTRWRREAPAMHAAATARKSEREALDALAPADRTWLESMGWHPQPEEVGAGVIDVFLGYREEWRPT